MSKRRITGENVFAFVYLIFIFGTVIISFGWFTIAVGKGIYHYATVKCADEVVPFSSSTEDDPTTMSGTSYLYTKGVNGEDNVCRSRSSSQEISREVIQTPTNEVVYEGSEVYTPYVPPVQTKRGCVITTCMDGSCSSSTGRGTCSWHGGEAY